MAAADAGDRRFFAPAADGILLFVRLTPRSSADRIEGIAEDAAGSVWLAARVRAVPEFGKANAALIALLAKRLKVPKSSIAIMSGETSRSKTVRISDPPDGLAALLDGLAKGR
ncbi:DUF167 family protein [Jiella sp. M17.18]|uniref:DUF167 family protein n=1 Tax=Jiella sp. M17.18 TaxID=3234247 RepID=UPI0034DFD3AA